MMNTKTTPAFILLCSLLSGCAQQDLPPAGPSVAAPTDILIQRLKTIEQQRIAAPQDVALRAEQAYITKKLVNDCLKNADVAVRQNNYTLASQQWREALNYEPGNLRALQGLRKTNARHALDTLYQEAVNSSRRAPERALHKIQLVLEEDPNWPQARALRDHLLREVAHINQPENRLNRELQKPVSLKFREHNLLAIFNTISQMTGVNIIFDKDIPATATASLIAKRTTAEDAINVLLLSNGMRKKVLNSHTLLIYPATPQKEKIYRDIVVKTVFLGYAKAKDVNIALRNMIKLKDVHVDERTNSVTLRGSKESVEKAERLLVTLDRPEAEVTLAVEVLEVNSSDIEALGINLPQKISAGFGKSESDKGEGNRLPIKDINSGNLRVNIDNMSIDLKKVLGNARVLANPRIRVKNNKKAQIDIGETIPVLTSNVQDGFSQQKVEYQEVGLKLEVTPDISMDDNISMDVKFTLSSLGVPEKGEHDTLYYRTNKREANTTLSSLNGETQMLAGLIKQDETDTNSSTPLLSKIPVLGRLFSSKSHNKQRTEVVLLITPTIDRNLDLPGSHISTIDMGSDDLAGDSIQLRGLDQPNSGPAFRAPDLAPPAHFPRREVTLPPPVLDDAVPLSGAR
ncbi:secretin N-terminal domain-containing protein [Serratia quinivorans]|uniref:secretin N-terminal domain-containing protein n=1 Tax=Serratia quinivorans TaxID=137545 RepID=UPI002177DDB5|nr:secretin N-terminal domain-containing protein [Serratia quinivorans]CAI1109074.1 Type IV pilus biogenesis and competence protein pilQ precursor [Serratia quinivorans]